MSKKIFLLGLIEKHSGKTFVAKNLGKYLTDMYNVIPFKPISGSNYWYHAENTEKIISDKLLLSQDLRDVLESISHEFEFSTTILNPIHTIFYPQQISSLINGETSISTLDKSGYWAIDQPLLTRYTIVDKSTGKSKIIHLQNQSSFPHNLDEVLYTADQVIPFSSLEELAQFDKKYSINALKSNFSWLNTLLYNQDDPSLMLIEGFNNFVPLCDFIEEDDLILIIAPGKIAILDTIKFLKVYKILNQEFLPTLKYLEYLKPQNVYNMPFNPSNQDWQNFISKFNLDI